MQDSFERNMELLGLVNLSKALSMTEKLHPREIETNYQ